MAYHPDLPLCSLPLTFQTLFHGVTHASSGCATMVPWVTWPFSTWLYTTQVPTTTYVNANYSIFVTLKPPKCWGKFFFKHIRLLKYDLMRQFHHLWPVAAQSGLVMVKIYNWFCLYCMDIPLPHEWLIERMEERNSIHPAIIWTPRWS